MAKAAEIDVSPDEPYARAAAQIVRVRAAELFEQAEGVLDTEDIERVHDMRVASRRLRAVLEVFAPCFPKGQYRSVLRDVKQLADALGERRDPDVQIATLQTLRDELGPENHPGVDLLIERAREDQERGNAALREALERMLTQDLRGRLEELTRP
jgi:CHAD domain-containing protein